MYKNERIDGGTPQVVISLNDVVNLKREELKDYCFSMEIRGGKIWLFSFKSDGELYGWMDEVYSVCSPSLDPPRSQASCCSCVLGVDLL
jgi:hypothetical protein